MRLPKFDPTQGCSAYSVIGLSALYASGYFLPPLTPVRAYLLPSNDLFRLIVVPSFIAAATVGIAIYLASIFARRWCSQRTCGAGAFCAICLFALIAANGILQAAGYQWQELIPAGRNVLDSQRHFKVLAMCAVVALVWTLRHSLRPLGRLLSSLGIAFAILATVRIVMLVEASTAHAVNFVASENRPAAQRLQGVSNLPSVPGSKSRRVVWILFDELDYRRVFSPENSGLELSHFEWLATRSVSATNANSPASATLYSVPALLAGTPLGGHGVHIVKPASLVMETTDETTIPLTEESTIFGALKSREQTVSILGFYHPYCKLFDAQRCQSFSYYELGGVWAALLANLPDHMVSRFVGGNLMERITKRSLELLPEYLERDDDLTFVHLNIPHLPASFADKTLHVAETEHGELEYSRNLKLVDEVLGTIISELQGQTSRHELLLVVSTDHWFRNIWFQPNVPEMSRPIPFLAWRVGEEKGISISEPVSTVHTRAMIEEYLRGTIDSQADIAEWWAKQPFYRSLVVAK